MNSELDLSSLHVFYYGLAVAGWPENKMAAPMY